MSPTCRLYSPKTNTNSKFIFDIKYWLYSFPSRGLICENRQAVGGAGENRKVVKFIVYRSQNAHISLC